MAMTHAAWAASAFALAAARAASASSASRAAEMKAPAASYAFAKDARAVSSDLANGLYCRTFVGHPQHKNYVRKQHARGPRGEEVAATGIPVRPVSHGMIPAGHKYVQWEGSRGGAPAFD